MNYTNCKECNAPIYADDMAIYMKLVRRDADEFLCIDCLARYFGCTRQDVEKLIKYYRENGTCGLFR